MARMNVAEIILQERLRVGSIIESKEGVARPSLARELALRSSLDVDAALALLAKSPSEENPFERAMRAESIGLTSLGGSPGPQNARERREAEIAANVKAFNKSKGYSK